MIVTIIGAGNGGHAVAGAMGLAGHTIRLYDIRDDVLAPVRERGGIQVTGGEIGGFAPVAYAGMDIAEAVMDANVVIMVVPGMAHRDVAVTLAPHVVSGQILLLHPGCTGGALEFRKALRLLAVNLPVAETDSFLYACRFLEPGRTHISAIKARIKVSVLPQSQTESVLDRLRELIPQVEAASSVLETSLANMNAMLHVGPMLTNAGRIQFTQGGFEFYGHGITHSVARLVRRADEERQALCRRLAVPTMSLSEWILATYGVSGECLYETIQTLQHEVYKSSRAPTALDHRYLTEDVPAGLVPMENIGHLAGLPMRLIGALITIASSALDTDFRRDGRTADRMGLTNLDVKGIRALVTV